MDELNRMNARVFMVNDEQSYYDTRTEYHELISKISVDNPNWIELSLLGDRVVFISTKLIEVIIPVAAKEQKMMEAE